MRATAGTDRGELTESLEDYLEVIQHVVEERQIVRPKDIVERMKVRGASVTGALRALAKRGLIRYAPYDMISLTHEGTEVAKSVIHRHTALKGFLTQILGIDKVAADSEACRMEHAVSIPVLDRLIKLGAFLQGCPRALLTSVAEVVLSGSPHDGCKDCKRSSGIVVDTDKEEP